MHDHRIAGRQRELRERARRRRRRSRSRRPPDDHVRRASGQDVRRRRTSRSARPRRPACRFIRRRPAACTVAGSTVHITSIGSCTVTASQPGNASFNAAADVAQTFAIAKANQTITFGALAAKTFGDADFAVSASASSGLAVSFAASGQVHDHRRNGAHHRRRLVHGNCVTGRERQRQRRGRRRSIVRDREGGSDDHLRRAPEQAPRRSQLHRACDSVFGLGVCRSPRTAVAR